MRPVLWAYHGAIIIVMMIMFHFSSQDEPKVVEILQGHGEGRYFNRTVELDTEDARHSHQCYLWNLLASVTRITNNVME